MTRLPETTPKTTQFDRILRRFATNAAGLARLLGREPSHVYRWGYPSSRGGTGGVIPAKGLRELVALARLQGVLLTSDDLDPREK